MIVYLCVPVYVITSYSSVRLTVCDSVPGCTCVCYRGRRCTIHDTGTLYIYSDVLPHLDTPLQLGKEDTALVPGEFCEVSNHSKQDPAEWFARVKAVVVRPGGGAG